MADVAPIGRGDDVAGDTAGAQASAEARYRSLAADTYAQGSTIGDILPLPEASEPSKHTGGDDAGFAA